MNQLVKILFQSFKAVLVFKLRTIFCLISVAMGIASITIIVAATEGAYQKAFEIVERFGPDAILIIGGSEEARAIGNREKTLTLGDVDAIKDSFPTAYLVVPMTAVRDVTASYRDRKYQTQVTGSGSNYSLAWSWPVVEGSDITEEDVRGLKNVGLIGRYLAVQLFGEENPVGKYLMVKGVPVQVVGVLQERGTTPRGDNLDNRIIMPITTVMRKLQNERKYVTVIRVRFMDQNRLDYYVEELKQFLRQRHRLPQGEPDDFMIVSPKEIITFLVALTGSLVLFLGVAGIMSLIVAGFVLANLFLLSVRERRKEIGIRRAVGAKQRDVLVQFLSESVILTTAGGLLGFLLGLLSSRLLMLVAEFPIYFSWKAFAVGLVLSLLVGVVFGLQPAYRAARLDPIEAIRK
jgi:putative ABC transport system permease protein